MKRNDDGTTVPRARKKALHVRELDDETLVYDLLRLKAHCLNRASALAWKLCDGRRTVGQVAERIGRETGEPVKPEFVWLALAQLEERHLLEGRVERPARVARLSRRELMRLAGGLGLALPFVASVLAPTPAQAVSLAPNGAACSNDMQCQSGCCDRATAGAPSGTCAAITNRLIPAGAPCKTAGVNPAKCCSNVCVPTSGNDGTCAP